ncbi:hypothetical protein OG555_18860 [Kribbella sp. NBC_01484]|uniref:CU044_2847 family protein n=1 Tax=Kribbella sp. NBC_01484 TaxID=2903579 RepID=UPI002E30DFBE|nr:CU044_2847 family protein [Kribbella sp. NBC_01484]
MDESQSANVIVYVQAAADEAEDGYGSAPVSRRDAEIPTFALNLQDALDKLTPAFGVISQHIETWARTANPAEVELKLGVKLTAEAGAIIAKTSAEGNLEVTLRWALEHKRNRSG